MSYFNRIVIDNNNQDIGGRLRVSETYTLGDYKSILDKNERQIHETINGTATSTFTSDTASVDMSVTNNNDFVIRQSYNYHSYNSGNTQLIQCTFKNFQPETNVIKKIGYFSSNATTPYNSNLDGFYLESSNGIVSLIMQRVGNTTFSIPQSSWNDPLDGTGDSEFTMDWSKFNVLVADFLYLGGTALRIGFAINGYITWVHVEPNAGLNANVMMKSPRQPIRYEIRSTGGIGSFSFICSKVATEGVQNVYGIPNSVSLNTPDVNANSSGTCYACIGIRKKTTYRDVLIQIQTLSAIETSNNQSFLWELRLNPTVAGTFVYNSHSTTSCMEVALGDTTSNPSTTTVTGGAIIASGYSFNEIIASEQLLNNIRLGCDINNNMDTIVLCAKPIGSK
jgi:hypothetical protein